MNITLGFIALFISIIIPGLLFQRFFFYGEFSKQFTTHDPILKSLVYAIIPSLFIQVFCFLLYFIIIEPDFKVSQLFSIHRNILNPVEKLEIETNDFLNNGLVSFIYYSLFVYAMSIFLGYFFSKTIRKLGWDKRFKILRYQNQWFYIFSGEIRSFEKFKDAEKSLSKGQTLENKLTTTFADVLVKSGENSSVLYTGYVVDYDLNSKNINELDKIYLYDAHRFKRTKLKEQSDSDELTPLKVEKKRIDGSLFILPVKNLINLNLTYTYHDNEKKQNNLINNLGYLFDYTTIAIVFIATITSPLIFIKLNFIASESYKLYFEHTGFFDKWVVLMVYTQAIVIIIDVLEPMGLFEKLKKLFFKALVLIFLIFLFLLSNWSWLKSINHSIIGFFKYFMEPICSYIPFLCIGMD